MSPSISAVKVEDFRYTFGPVPSRRLGKSLGINNIPAKTCTYACIYCQVGRTTRMQVDRSVFYEPEDIIQDVQRRLEEAKAGSERVDYLAFVPDGEPTLDANLGKEISLLKKTDIPIGVITNGSLVWREDVRKELGPADWVSLKIDTVREAVWRRINRPHKGLRLSNVLDGMRAFSSVFAGTLVTETMLVRGINDTEGCMKEVADFIHTLRPARAYLSVPTRPPAEKLVRGPSEKTLAQAYEIFGEKTGQAEYLIGYEGDAFASTGDVVHDLLSITAVHPMREEAVGAFLSRSRSSWETVEKLVVRGDLVKTAFDGHFYYLRRFAGSGGTVGILGADMDAHGE